MRALTKYTAAPIDSIASRALARKMRLVIEPRTRISRKYNPRVWMVLAAVLAMSIDSTAAARRAEADATDRQAQTVSLPPGKTLSIEVTIGIVRIEGSDREDAEIVVERRAPNAAQLARVPLAIDDTPRASASARCRPTTPPTLRSGLMSRCECRARRRSIACRCSKGASRSSGFSGTLTADIRRGPIDGKDVSGTLRLEAGIGSVTLTDARLSARTACCGCARSTATCGCRWRSAPPTRASWRSR